MSSSITPNTDPDVALEGVERRSSSPAITKAQRRGRQSLPSSLPQIKTFSRSRESLRRKTRYSSVSTDELARSPLSASDRNERKPHTRKLARQSFVNQHPLEDDSTAGRGIFEGMVFALSFQGPQVRKNKGKPTDRANVERMIRQEGGKILPDGFDELFKFDSFQSTGNNTSSRDLSSSLTLLDQDTGFTALIADGHSRKVKYMQALALGIPCLAPKWIMNCISKREIIDWSSYLLCAGPSTLLGEAIRSRNLQPYDASTAKLADVVNERPKLLNKARILLVMKKTKNEGKKLPYVFLAQVLGGSLVRVYSLEEARVKLRDEESQNQPFDWVYVDDSLHNARDALFGSSTGNAATRKRKRQSTGSEETDPPPKRIRTLSDELVIQSLILGRLIEDGEMEE
ncbi:DNA repair protein rhp9 [Daldinia childiae]|uniref:DNA repair protein rhp9 n=1 Tax=Daldinia childiae TaxID=326645 RepID=UPI001445BD26|nr:DNA repair protein rhp9 [Daldinia childiae]KAF3064036.1 DNA repair protein rhp9 [Daldinia childiae]